MRTFLFLAISCLLSGCYSTGTPYQPTQVQVYQPYVPPHSDTSVHSVQPIGGQRYKVVPGYNPGEYTIYNN